MLEQSQFLGTEHDIDVDELKSRVGHSDPPTAVSLFTGVGGLDLGFEDAGFDVRVMIEEDETACDTLRRNMDHFDEHTEPVIFDDDIHEVSTEDILEAADLRVGELTAVIGGPPCPGFSHANNDRSPDDPRNQLYLEMVRVVNEAKPKFFVMENVPGMATMKDGEVIQQVCEDFRECGYHVTWEILDAADYGVPQHRERVIMIGRRVDVLAQPQFGNVQFHLAAKPGRIEPPESFRDKHGLDDPEQTGLEGFTESPETVDEMLEQIIENGMEVMQ